MDKEIYLEMNRHEMADLLDGMPGFDRDKFYLATAARSWYEASIMPLREDDSKKSCQYEARIRFSELHKMREMPHNV